MLLQILLFPYSSAVLAKMVFASLDSRFCRFSISGQGLNATVHRKCMPELKDSHPGDDSKAVAFCGKNTVGNKCCPVNPSHSVQATGPGFCQLQIHFLFKESIHLLKGCPGMAFSLFLSGATTGRKPSRLCFVS